MKRRDGFIRIDSVNQIDLAMPRADGDSTIRQHREGPGFDDRILRQGNVDDRIKLALAFLSSPALANLFGAQSTQRSHCNRNQQAKESQVTTS